MTDKPADFKLKIPLFEGAKVLTKEGESIKQDQSIVELSQDRVVEVSLASALKVKPIKIVSLLEVGLGREVKESQILAQKKGFFRKRKVLSPVTGQVESLVEDQGVLKIRTSKKSIEVRAPVSAKVVSFKKNFLVLQFLALVFPARQAFGKSGWGDLKDFSGHLFDLKEVEGKIVLVENLTEAIFNKLEALGAIGAVGVKAEKGIKQEVDESGLLVLSEKDFEKVKENVGKRAKIDVGDKRLIIAK